MCCASQSRGSLPGWSTTHFADGPTASHPANPQYIPLTRTAASALTPSGRSGFRRSMFTTLAVSSSKRRNGELDVSEAVTASASSSINKASLAASITPPSSSSWPSSLLEAVSLHGSSSLRRTSNTSDSSLEPLPSVSSCDKSSTAGRWLPAPSASSMSMSVTKMRTAATFGFNTF